ncbi:hypothetical protein [Pedobacter hiemivivus]|uniref:Uncharacterized protein n=1 Tax=Pedobacter hiemivivus TaxID=2530454 RepID=A0A4V2MKU8_9SPHI|nr:hypothetical protein [Pedobacter hiemivivus]TCC99546.1 hypothetical protein EZ444_02395 [Pedobacter hiemivivus]
MKSFKEVNNLEILDSSERLNERLISDPRFSQNSFTYNRLYISSINQAKISFTNKSGQKFYPSFTEILVNSYMHAQGDMDGATLVNYDDPLSASFFNLKPFQTIFYGKSRQSQDLWSLVLSFLLPDRLVNSISLIELEDVQRLNSAAGMNSTPLIQLTEYRIEENLPKTELIINENLQTVNTEYMKYAF